ncbi:MAG: hypothetical protein V1787_02135 [Candidatus Micrarchaeota archaeon]
MRELKALGYLTLIAGGFLVITYFAFVYFAVWRHEFLPLFPESQRFAAPAVSDSATVPGFNASAVQDFGRDRFDRPRGVADPLSLVFSPQSLGILLVGALLLANGFFVLRHVNRQEHKETRKFVTSSLLTGDEKSVYDELVRQGGESTQRQLCVRTGFSPVKTFRVLRRLEAKKVVKTFPFGMTKKIVLSEP